MSINIGINGFGRIGRWVILFLASDALVWPILMGLSMIIRGGCRQQCHGQSCSLIVCSCRRIYRFYELLSCISFWNCSSIAGCIVYVLSSHSYLTSYHHSFFFSNPPYQTHTRLFNININANSRSLVMRAAKKNPNINIVAVNDPFIPVDYSE